VIKNIVVGGNVRTRLSFTTLRRFITENTAEIGSVGRVEEIQQQQQQQQEQELSGNHNDLAVSWQAI